jgi:tocopherol O-methyltransferase
MHDNEAAVANYYDTHQFSYTHFWSPTALHYGLWFPETKTLREATRNTDRLVASSLQLTSEDVVLDAGCGVGGTSIFVAERFGANVEGITVSQVQLRVAERARLASSASARTRFTKQNFHKTNFDDSTFSAVFGVEAICYAQPKAAFLAEAYRVLRRPGRVVIVDTFLNTVSLTASETTIYAKFIDGWIVPDLPTRDEFAAGLATAGFSDITFHNLQNLIWPSVRRVFLSSLLTAPANLITSRLGLGRENLSAFYQKAFFERGLGTYGMFTARKA